MKNPRGMTDKQIVAWLNKTKATIGNYVHDQGGSLYAYRGQDLVDRYNDLVHEMTFHRRPLWYSWCEATGADTAHNGYDLFA